MCVGVGLNGYRPDVFIFFLDTVLANINTYRWSKQASTPTYLITVNPAHQNIDHVHLLYVCVNRAKEF